MAPSVKATCAVNEPLGLRCLVNFTDDTNRSLYRKFGAAVFVSAVFTFGGTKAFGVFYVEFLEIYGEGSGATAWIVSFSMSLMLACGIFSTWLTQMFSVRSVMIVGGVISAFGHFISIFVTKMELLYLTYGIFTGIGRGLCFTPSLLMVNTYFVKKRAMANGMAFAGSGVGAFALPFVTRFLLDTYGLNGSLLVFAGLMLNICVCGALMRPFRTGDGNSIANTSAGSAEIEDSGRDPHQKESSGKDSVPVLTEMRNESESSVVEIPEVIIEMNSRLYNAQIDIKSLAKLNGPPQDNSVSCDSKSAKYTVSCDPPTVDNMISCKPERDENEVSCSSERVENRISFHSENEEKSLSFNSDKVTNSSERVENKVSCNSEPEENTTSCSSERDETKTFFDSYGDRNVSEPLLPKDETFGTNICNNKKDDIRQNHLVLEQAAENIYRNTNSKGEGSGKNNDRRTLKQEESSSNATIQKDTRYHSCCKRPPSVDLSLLKNPVYVMYETAFLLGTISYLTNFTMLPAHAVHIGFAKPQADFLLSVVGLADIAGRTIIGWFSDLKIISRANLSAGCLILGAVAALLLPLSKSYAVLCAYAASVGVLPGAATVVVFVLMLERIGSQAGPSVYGIHSTLFAIPALLGPPLAGWLQDWTGTWNASFRMVGCFMLASTAIILFVGPALVRRLRKAS